MANNRLYLVDTETWECIILATGYTNGWAASENIHKRLDPFLDLRDIPACMNQLSTKLALFTEADLPPAAKLWTKPRLKKRQ